ncbi:hypothetical protein JTI58_12140 [Lysinibacillus fusiformis]|uniref:hypothetical protein n=1 Tax=Lysinibacillus fusiformis TaxID=28031 RepID=UPI0019680681|nr:hypothetical protein [Lysinibacillus fusiformis]QSB12307.1 hypothetical protein JTI58_12140 [Lysinibacillus fusiformis]
MQTDTHCKVLAEVKKKVYPWYDLVLKMHSSIHEVAPSTNEDSVMLFSTLKVEGKSNWHGDLDHLNEKLLPFISITFPQFSIQTLTSENDNFEATYEAQAMTPYKYIGDLFHQELACKDEAINDFIQEHNLADIKLTVYIGACIYE